jgi:hypothetical protein
MKKLLPILLLLLSCAAFSQNLEICRDQDTLRAQGASAYGWYSSLDCGGVDNPDACNAYSDCVWLVQICVTTSMDNPTACEFITDSTSCADLPDYGCYWDGDCKTRDNVIHNLVSSEEAVTLAESTDKYMLTGGSGFAIGFQADNVATCSLVTGLNAEESSVSSVYPNPVSTEELKIELRKPVANVNIQVIDARGTIVSELQDQKGQQFWVNSADWAPGTYQVIITIAGERQVMTVVK